MERKRANTLGKAEKLKSRKQIEALFGAGKSFFVHPLKVFCLTTKAFTPVKRLVSELQVDGSNSNLPSVQVGVGVSKRNFKKAVDRNRIKRLLREAYRLNKQELVTAAANSQLNLHLFFIYVDNSHPTFILIEEKMKACLKRLVKQVEDNR